jgi:predicted nucleotidyltransferase
MEIQEICRLCREKLRRIYGARLKKLILYGSWARGTATEDSDIDLAVVLEGQVSVGREIDRLVDFITDMNLEYNVLVSIYPVTEDDYESLKSPLLLNVRKEGIPA